MEPGVFRLRMKLRRTTVALAKVVRPRVDPGLQDVNARGLSKVEGEDQLDEHIHRFALEGPGQE